MLSPKVQRIQRSIRINEGQLLGLAEKARYDSRLAGFLYKRCADNNKWLLRWFRLYQVSTILVLPSKNPNTDVAVKIGTSRTFKKVRK